MNLRDFSAGPNRRTVGARTVDRAMKGVHREKIMS
jgi:hypothetical protein